MPVELEIAGCKQVLDRLSGKFLIKRVSPDRVHDLCTFFKRAYQDQPLAAAFQNTDSIRRFWTWLYEMNPVSFDGAPAAWVCLEEDRVVGHFALLPVRVTREGQPVPVCWGSGLIVAPEARQHGLGPMLIMTAVEAAQQPVLIAGGNEAVYPIYARLGFLEGGRVPLYLKVFQPGRLLDTLPWPRFARQFVAGALRARSRGWRRRNTKLSIVPIERFDDQFDRWWGRIEGMFRCVIQRTSKTMNWRYQQHPRHRYRAFAALEGGQLRGIVVVRSGHSRGLPAGFITELLARPDDHDALKCLLIHAQEFLASSAAEPPVFLRCAVLHEMFERALRRAGFMRVQSPIHFMLTHAQGASSLGSLTHRDRWLLNAGDSDLDVL